MPQQVKKFRAKTYPSAVPARSEDFEKLEEAIAWLNGNGGCILEQRERGEWFNHSALKAGKLVPFTTKLTLEDEVVLVFWTQKGAFLR
jgi:hypothetical protein